MRICPKCRTAYPMRGRATCANDGTRLVHAEVYAAGRSDPLIGRCVAGRFHVRERVGIGGMGTVYRAEQAGLARPVALKVLKGDLVSDRDTVVRFHREAKAMSMLIHPNTVRVFDFGEDEDGHLFLAMELLEGELLTAWGEREGAPPIEEAIDVIRQVLRSLAEAHRKGIIHRDLKPDNIYLARVEGQARPVVKVLDFGIAKVFRDELKIDPLETQAGTVFGTPRYMSPEQAQGKALDHRSDLYSVGVLLYQLLTGRPPFLDDDAIVVMAKHIRETPEPIRRAAPGRPIPRSLEKVVEKALAKEPEDRFADADAFEQELERCLSDVRAEVERLDTRRSSGGFLATASSLPRIPLAIGGGLVTGALAVAVAIVASSGADEIAEARDTGRPSTGVMAKSMGAVQPPAPAPLPALTTVELRSEPDGASIWKDDQHLGQTPHTFRLNDGETVQLTLRLEGHRDTPIELSPSAAPTQEVHLPPEPRLAPLQARPRATRVTRPRRTRRREEQPLASSIQPEATQPESEATPPEATAPPVASDGPYERFE